MRGFIQGSLWALVVGGTGLSIASLVNEQPQFASGPPTPQLVAPELGAVEMAPEVSLSITPQDTPVFAPAVPLEPAAEAAGTTPDVATESATLPETADLETAMEAPTEQPEPELSSEADTPIAASDGTVLPDASPAPEATPQEQTPVNSVVVEVTPQEDAGAAEDASEETADAPLIVIHDSPIEGTNDIVVTEDPDAVDAEADTEASDTIEATAPAQEEASGVVADAVTDAPEPNVTEAPADEPVQQEPEQPAEETTTAQPVVITPTVDDPEVVQSEEPAALPQTNTGVRVNRPTEATTEDDETVVEEEAPDDRPALERYAAVFENPDNLPVISVILLDEGAVDGPDTVADLGFLPTVVVNALSANAEDTVAAYRAAGLEVAMQIALPSGSQPTDIEIAFQAAFDMMPETAMFFSNGTGVVQDNRNVTTQVMEILAADGRGFVTVQRGLGNAVRAAEQEGVAAATVLRDLDGVGEDQRAITRALDQAAFRARQSGGAILMGRVTPETLGALRDWAATIDPETLLIAPVSAVLLTQDDDT